jgi:hypothetical protein
VYRIPPGIPRYHFEGSENPLGYDCYIKSLSVATYIHPHSEI